MSPPYATAADVYMGMALCAALRALSPRRLGSTKLHRRVGHLRPEWLRDRHKMHTCLQQSHIQHCPWFQRQHTPGLGGPRHPEVLDPRDDPLSAVGSSSFMGVLAIIHSSKSCLPHDASGLTVMAWRNSSS